MSSKTSTCMENNWTAEKCCKKLNVEKCEWSLKLKGENVPHVLVCVFKGYHVSPFEYLYIWDFPTSL